MAKDIKKCLCKKDFHSKLCRFEIFNDFNNKLLFKKNNLYDCYIENNGDTIWVIYNKFGSSTTSGLRFHLKKEKDKIMSMYNFYEFFKSERATKITIINEKQQ